MLNPVDFPEPEAPHVAPPATGPTRGSSDSPNFVRRNPEASVNDPQIVPTTTSAAPNPNPPLPPGVRPIIGDHDADPGGPGTRSNGERRHWRNVRWSKLRSLKLTLCHRLRRCQKTIPKVISKGVITGEALSLPKPAYPPLAKQMGIQGKVSVQVLIDESGRVVSAKATLGKSGPDACCSEGSSRGTVFADATERSAGEGVGRYHLQLRAAVSRTGIPACHALAKMFVWTETDQLATLRQTGMSVLLNATHRNKEVREFCASAYLSRLKGAGSWQWQRQNCLTLRVSIATASDLGCFPHCNCKLHVCQLSMTHRRTIPSPPPVITSLPS